jgi:multidrug transporter EmrE-like cation transporter
MMKRFSQLKLKHSVIKPILIIILCTIFTSLGQVLLKMGTNNIDSVNNNINIISVLNWQLILGLIFYIIGAILLIIALKYGELSIIYPFISLSFIWVMLLSTYMFDEKVLLINWVGLICILLGVSLIGQGGRK